MKRGLRTIGVTCALLLPAAASVWHPRSDLKMEVITAIPRRASPKRYRRPLTMMTSLRTSRATMATQAMRCDSLPAWRGASPAA